MMNKLYVGIIWLVLFGCQQPRDLRSNLPIKENFWIFVLAGQSNMAGRGTIEPADTVPDSRIWVLDSTDHWSIAQEPLHYYEPDRTGLDCGLSFAKELLNRTDHTVNIGLVPCAVGGSSVEQWLGDSTYRGVQLFSNLSRKMLQAEQKGIIKGILWHQGESNANPRKIVEYEKKLLELFDRFRFEAHHDSLQILAGELGSYLSESQFGHYPDTINAILHRLPSKDINVTIISTKDLVPKEDTIHFDSPSLRTLGRRFARSVRL